MKKNGDLTNRRVIITAIAFGFILFVSAMVALRIYSEAFGEVLLNAVLGLALIAIGGLTLGKFSTGKIVFPWAKKDTEEENPQG